MNLFSLSVCVGRVHTCVLLILNFYFIILADCIFCFYFNHGPGGEEAMAAANATRRQEANAADLMRVHLLIILRFHHNKCS